MNNLIETSYDLRIGVGQNYEGIKRLDLLNNRSEEARIKNKLINDHGQRCAYCQKEKEVIAAHIVPLEVGGRTVEENMILLCDDCHTKYDSGCLSIQAMLELAEEWRSGKSKPHPRLECSDPPQAIIPPPSSIDKGVLDEVQDNARKRCYPKAISIVDKTIKNKGIGIAGQSYLLIKKAELTRRRNKRNMLVNALSTLQSVNLDEHSKEYLPYFYYEKGYVYRLKGNPIEAANIFSQSLENDLPQLEVVAASVNGILCSMVVEDFISQEKANDFVKRLQELEEISSSCGGYWGGRWALNCAAHRLQVHLKRRDEKESWKALEHLRTLSYQSDRNTGWDEATKPTLAMLEGLTRVLVPKDNEDLQSGIYILARAFVTRINPRQRPEGIRDVGFGLIEGIRKSCMNLTETTDAIGSLLNQTVDGTSVLWPWRDD
jgi:tetratricopeptide (TPR) repeat protein